MIKDTNDKKTVLVLGINGQDGSYVGQHLLAQGYAVIGLGRQENSKWIKDSDHFKYISHNLIDIEGLRSILSIYRPSIIYHMAALHGPSGFKYEEHWSEAHLINTITTHAVLEYLRTTNIGGGLIYLSSSKVFDIDNINIVDELTARKSTCIYTITKNSATDLIGYYRRHHGIRSSVVWTFNHESPRRSCEYFIPKVANILSSALCDRKYTAEVKTLKFWCDWGSASEYMKIVIEIAENSIGEDYILATGESIWAEDVVSQIFGEFDLLHTNHISEQITYSKDYGNRITANISKLKSIVKRTPVIMPSDIIREMVMSKIFNVVAFQPKADL